MLDLKPHVAHTSTSNIKGCDPQDLFAWLRDNVGQKRQRWMLYGGPFDRVWFLREKDAVLFKLTWL